MATLNIKVNGKTETCMLYSTKEEAGDSPLSLKVGGNMAYAAMTTELTDSEITSLRVKMNGATYAVRKQAKPAYQTVKLTIGTDGYYVGYDDNMGKLVPTTVYGETILGFYIRKPGGRPALEFYAPFGIPTGDSTFKCTGNKLRLVIPELNIDTGYVNGVEGDKSPAVDDEFAFFTNMQTQFAANVGKTIDMHVYFQKASSTDTSTTRDPIDKPDSDPKSSSSTGS